MNVSIHKGANCDAAQSLGMYISLQLPHDWCKAAVCWALQLQSLWLNEYLLMLMTCWLVFFRLRALQLQGLSGRREDIYRSGSHIWPYVSIISSSSSGICNRGQQRPYLNRGRQRPIPKLILWPTDTKMEQFFSSLFSFIFFLSFSSTKSHIAHSGLELLTLLLPLNKCCKPSHPASFPLWASVPIGNWGWPWLKMLLAHPVLTITPSVGSHILNFQNLLFPACK